MNNLSDYSFENLPVPSLVSAQLLQLLGVALSVIEKQTDLISNQITHMANELDTFLADQAAINNRVDAGLATLNDAVTGIKGDVNSLNDRIKLLTDNQGNLTDAQKDTIAELETHGQNIAAGIENAATAAKALDDATPPVVPAGDTGNASSGDGVSTPAAKSSAAK